MSTTSPQIYPSSRVVGYVTLDSVGPGELEGAFHEDLKLDSDQGTRHLRVLPGKAPENWVGFIVARTDRQDGGSPPVYSAVELRASQIDKGPSWPANDDAAAYASSLFETSFENIHADPVNWLLPPRTTIIGYAEPMNPDKPHSSAPPLPIQRDDMPSESLLLETQLAKPARELHAAAVATTQSTGQVSAAGTVAPEHIRQLHDGSALLNPKVPAAEEPPKPALTGEKPDATNGESPESFFLASVSRPDPRQFRGPDITETPTETLDVAYRPFFTRTIGPLIPRSSSSDSFAMSIPTELSDASVIALSTKKIDVSTRIEGNDHLITVHLSKSNKVQVPLTREVASSAYIASVVATNSFFRVSESEAFNEPGVNSLKVHEFPQDLQSHLLPGVAASLSWGAIHMRCFKNDSENSMYLSFTGLSKFHLFNDIKYILKAITGYETKEFKNALTIVNEFQSKYPDKKIILTGHSMGGSFASYCGIKNGLDVVSFNGMGLHRRIIKKLTKSTDVCHITQINSNKDWLTQGLQRNILVQPGGRYKIFDFYGHGLSYEKKVDGRKVNIDMCEVINKHSRGGVM